MQHLFHSTLAVLFCLFPFLAHAQNLLQLMAAEEYHRMMPGPEKIERIRELERKGWYHQDAYFDLKGKPMESPKTDLAPFVGEMGETVFFVTDIAPCFPGGQASFQDYLQNTLGRLLAKPGESVQNSLRFKFLVEKDGAINMVESAQPIAEWIPAEVVQQCLQALQEMPAWSPGIYKGRPVAVKMLMVFGLGE